jgi:hypothetical protein
MDVHVLNFNMVDFQRILYYKTANNSSTALLSQLLICTKNVHRQDTDPDPVSASIHIHVHECAKFY